MIGELYDQIQFKRAVRTRRSDGGADVTETTLSTVYASVVPVSAREGEQAGRLAGFVTHIIKIHYSDLPADLTVDDELIWVSGGNVRFNIRGIKRPGARNMLAEIIAESGNVAVPLSTPVTGPTTADTTLITADSTVYSADRG